MIGLDLPYLQFGYPNPMEVNSPHYGARLLIFMALASLRPTIYPALRRTERLHGIFNCDISRA